MDIFTRKEIEELFEIYNKGEYNSYIFKVFNTVKKLNNLPDQHDDEYYLEVGNSVADLHSKANIKFNNIEDFTTFVQSDYNDILDMAEKAKNKNP